MTTEKILNIHTRENGFIMRSLISENRDLIDEVKYYISNGWNKLEAIDFVLFDEWAFKFKNEEDKRTLLKEWMCNKMHC